MRSLRCFYMNGDQDDDGNDDDYCSLRTVAVLTLSYLVFHLESRPLETRTSCAN